jgi:long-chain acyl-CoA synthetase
VRPPLPPRVRSARHGFLFCRYEFVKRIHLTNEVFSVENNCLTPTMKVRRRDVQKKYKAELDALYALGEPKWAASPKL